MAKRISDWLRERSNLWVALIALVIFMVFPVIVLPDQAEQAEAYSGGAGSPDSSFFYTPADLYRTAEAYGEAGRAAYVRARWTFDVVWPLAYTFFLVTAIGWLFGKAFPAESTWQLANLVPLLGMIFDFLENSATSLVMLRYPAETPVVAALAPAFTVIKWILIAASFGLLVLGVIRSRLNR